jgi:hypothetical protein
VDELLGYWRIADSPNDEKPEAKHSQKVDHEYDAPESNVPGEDLNGAMH